jgi:anti-anti-sigma factor
MSFSASLATIADEARITLSGQLDASVSMTFQKAIEDAMAANPKRLVLFMNELTYMASAGLRVLVFAKQKMGSAVSLYIVGSQGPVLHTLELSGFAGSVYIQDAYAPQ